MVTRDLRIRRFTPAAEKAMNIIPSDIGRPIGHLKPNFVCPDLEEMITEVVDTVSIRERQVEGLDGRVFALQVRPYKSVENRIDGAVVVMFDVSIAQDQAAALEVAQVISDALMSSVPRPVLLMDSALKVLRINQAFADRFQVSASDADGRSIYEIAGGSWDKPEVRRFLGKALHEKPEVERLEFEPVVAGGPRVRFSVDAWPVASGRPKQGVVLLVLHEKGENN